jgi:hypothetical protein
MHLRFTGEWAGETRHIVKDSAELFAREVIPRFAPPAQAIVESGGRRGPR